MCGKELIALLIVGFARISQQASTPSSPFYTAGVVEFNSSLLVSNNLDGYLEIITSDEAKETDIIIFPEATLNGVTSLTYVPDPNDSIAPCNRSEYAAFLQKLSCQAKTSQKYIVVNLAEKENCTGESQAAKKDPRPCGRLYLTTYNTNVVFDRNGVVVSRYRKFNLYYEPWNVTYTPEYGQFDTDFGVKFGHFICFDILFFTPTTELVKSGITDFIFPTMWFSELPFLTAAQTQQSWAYSYDVNLLAAGASNPSLGNTGTGIYAGRNGPITLVMSSLPERKLYVAQVPKKGFKNNHTKQLQIRKKRATTSTVKNVLVKRDSRIDAFTTVLLDPSKGSTKLCHGQLCCNFTYNVSEFPHDNDSVSYQYRLAAFDGNRIYPGIDPLGWSVCSILACVNSTLEGCGLVFDENLSIEPKYYLGPNFLIEADFDKTENVLLMPNSVDDQLLPLPVDEFQFNVTDKGNKKHARLELLEGSEHLLQFGIYVNYFHERSLASAMFISRLLVAVSSVLTFVVYLQR